MTETEIAKAAIAFLNNDGWEVYQEVQPTRGGPVCDIVATKGHLVWALEVKTSFGLTVMRQAQHWTWRSHFTSVVVPAPTRNNGDEYNFAQIVCRQFGIGVLQMDRRNPIVLEKLAPVFHRTAKADWLRKVLSERHKTFAEAGNNLGKRWTPFQETCENLRTYIQKNPGAHLKEALDKIKHHYHMSSTARACIKQWASAGKIAGIRIEKEGKHLRLYAVDV